MGSLGCLWGAFGSLWGALGLLLGASWALLGPCWPPLGGLLEARPLGGVGLLRATWGQHVAHKLARASPRPPVNLPTSRPTDLQQAFQQQYRAANWPRRDARSVHKLERDMRRSVSSQWLLPRQKRICRSKLLQNYELLSSYSWNKTWL